LVMKKKVEDSSSSDEGEETKTVAAGVKDPQVSKSDDRYWVSKSLTSAFSAPKGKILFIVYETKIFNVFFFTK